MSDTVDRIRQAILDDDLPGIGEIPVPSSYRAAVVRADEVDMFAGMATRDKDPRKSLHVQEVPTPELGPGEAIVAVMASAINYNTVWTSIFEPVSTFSFLKRYGKSSPLAAKHDLPYHIVGSDLSGVVLQVGPGRTDAILVLDIADLDATTGDENVTVRVVGNTTADFSGNFQILATLELGASLPLTVIDTVPGRYELPFSNARAGVEYPYAKLHFDVSGTTPSITCDAWIAQQFD